MRCTTCTTPSALRGATGRHWYRDLFDPLLRFAQLRASAHLRLIPFAHERGPVDRDGDPAVDGDAPSPPADSLEADSKGGRSWN
ncbi:MAG TPA: hypothetical protein VLA56_17010 [Pseudomonadales bacterium]|nr:hypothetical protein [Pseudomonadales bacterium]